MLEFPLRAGAVGAAGALPPLPGAARAVVVGVLGKSPLRRANKATPLFTRLRTDRTQIECHWDEKSNILYLHLSSYFDTHHLSELVARLGAERDDDTPPADGIELARREGDYLVATGDLTAEVCRSILLMFHLCHIIILSHPTPVFDISYLHLFKALDVLRVELQPRMSEVLTAVGVRSEWATHGRPCCPRVLFYFHTCPRQLRRSPAKLKRLAHCLEDQIYLILRKARIITNICAKSLFAIPKNEEFVYINDSSEDRARDLSCLVRTLVQRCQGGETGVGVGFGALAWDTGKCSLKQFLQTHIDLAFSTGFDDNVGKFAMSTFYFEIPSAQTWRTAAQALTDLILGEEEPAPWSTLWDALATDARFSAARCAKVLPVAQASYTEGLPSHYSTQHHHQKVAVAVGVFDTMARGPLCAFERARLEEACANIWKSRRLCETLSLTGNPCVKPKHADNSEEVHSSGVRYVSACNCGRTKCTREDPYSVRRANHQFYASADCHVCPTLQSVTFPVFQPSTNSYRAASVKPSSGVCTPRVDGDDGTQGSPDLWSGEPSPAEALSPGEQSDPDADEQTASKQARTQSYELVPVGHDQSKDKGIVRQPSTTEYLPGMMHTESPPGLLPVFPSWSLVCLGASSLYSHNMGLPEHLHPGFLPHTNFLLPWDCAVRLEQVSAWRVAQAASRGRSTKPPAPHQLTVKIFLGLEYECPRGHRFMMSSPDTVVNGSVMNKDAGAELANTDMPVYCHCPCRGSKTMLAQLTRVHVVSPKAPVHITLNPKVQPVANGPVFIPGCEAPVKLSGSAYWLLRLPYVYSAERGVLPRPSVPVPASQHGKLLSGMFGVTD